MKFVILGVDSTHTEAFCEAIAGSALLRRDAQVIGFWGEDLAQARQKAEKLGVSRVFGSLEEAVEAAEAVFVLGRFPESHFQPALKALKAGRPVYVDKPFVLSPTEAGQLISESRESRVPLMSCSVYRFASQVRELVSKGLAHEYSSFCLSGPRECNDLGNDPRFKDISFYGIHLIEIMLEVLGFAVTDFKVSSSPRSSAGTVVYEDGRQCTLQFMTGMKSEDYHFLGFDGADWKDYRIQYAPKMYEELISQILNHLRPGGKRWPIESNLAASRIIACLKGADWNA